MSGFPAAQLSTVKRWRPQARILPGERDRDSHLDDRKVGQTPVHPKRLRQMTMMMGNRAREAILDAVYRIEPEHSLCCGRNHSTRHSKTLVASKKVGR